MSLWKQIEDLHYRQHKAVEVVLDTRRDGNLSIDKMELIDEMVVEFVNVTEELDKALGELERAIV